MTPHSVATEVVGALHRLLPRSKGIYVVEDAISNRDGWWHVPIRRNHEATQSYEYYVLIAEAEQALEDAGLDVILVPAGNDSVVN
jgi:hypothetical protein